MSVEHYTFDTNILFYALDPDAGEKHRVASSLIASADTSRALLILQTLGELCNSVQRKNSSAAQLAYTFVERNTVLFDVVHALPSDLTDAIDTHQTHNIPFWDAMLWATARRAGCTLLLSEDFQDGRTLGGVAFRNPFTPGFKLPTL
jgi:predicted nucleic acid-binding protein